MNRFTKARERLSSAPPYNENTSAEDMDFIMTVIDALKIAEAEEQKRLCKNT